MATSKATDFSVKFEPTCAPAYIGTYIGGPATSVAVDSSGHAFVTGWTRSFLGDRDAFVWKLDSNAGVLPIMFTLNFGGCLDDAGVAVAVDPAGNAVVAVESRSVAFPTTAAGPVSGSALVRLSSDGTSHQLDVCRRFSASTCCAGRCRGRS